LVEVEGRSPRAETPPQLVAPWETTRLEALALRAGMDANELRELLYDEIERRRVAQAGDGPETTPGPHRQRI
jgi:hypothetical protein